MARGDAELASVMRKLVANEEVYVSTGGHGIYWDVTIDGSVPIDEQEQQIIEELMDQ